MRAIELFRGELAGTRRDFVESHPWPFVVFTSGPAEASAPADVRMLTIDRFVVEGTRPVGNSVMAAQIAAKDPRENVVTIGLAPTCDVVIADSSLSKQHAWFARGADGWQLWDNDSVSGTQVNGKLLTSGSSKTLQSGDVITLGYVELTFLAPEAFYSLVKYLVGG